MSIPTEITIRPSYGRDEPIFGVRTNGDTDQVSRADVMNAANPLRQIPFVSQVYEAATGEKGSAVAKLIGGALVGGPIGFLASLATVIFEQESGTSVGTAIASAFKGGEETTQLASAASTKTASLQGVQEAPDEMAALAVPAANMEILPPEKAQRFASLGQKAQMNLASAIGGVGGSGGMDASKREQDQEVLALFGGQKPSAHQSYQKAQMLPYLQDVSTSLVL